MTTDDEILRLTKANESQSVEFKETISTGCKEEGTRSLVAFANREGGRVIFGVAKDRTLKGVDLGEDTIEKLANYVTAHTYPSLPVHIETVDVAGKQVVVTEAVSDRPPLIGLYMHSAKGITPDDPVDANQLVALRRVGRTNQEVDIMWLRPEIGSDPKLRLSVGRFWSESETGMPMRLRGRAWVEAGSASAHRITFETEPPYYASGDVLDDLPVPFISTGSGGKVGEARPPAVAGWNTFQDFLLERQDGSDEGPFALVATYFDDAGIMWEARRSILADHRVTENGKRLATLASGSFQRRIRKFPPKRFAP